MRIVAKQLFVLIFSFALLYAVIWCFTYIVYPTTRNYLDTYQDAVYFSNDKPDRLGYNQVMPNPCLTSLNIFPVKSAWYSIRNFAVALHSCASAIS